MLYAAIKALLGYAFHIFYSITVINGESVPQGHVIIYANHPNYITDLMVILVTNVRCLRPIVASISMKTIQMGCYLKGIGSIQVTRHQDVQKQLGKGTVHKVESGYLFGKNTKFEEFKPGTTFYIENKPSVKISKIISNQKVKIEQQNIQIEQPTQFLFKPVISYNSLYEEVWKTLNKNQDVLIFPEGQVQINKKMIPFKAGICKMALGATLKQNSKIKLLPCALHYRQQHIFRSQIVVEYGQAYHIPEEIVSLYQSDRRKATGMLLEVIESKIKQMVAFDNVQQEDTMVLFRRLYTLDWKRKISPDEKVSLNRFILKIIKSTGYQSNQIIQRFQNFNHFLKGRGISVTQKHVSQNLLSFWFEVIFQIMLGLFFFVLMIPGYILWGLMITLVCILAQTERKYWEKWHVDGRDCLVYVSSYKIFLSILFMSLNYFATCALLQPICSLYQIQNYWLILCIVLLVLQLLYIPFFLKCYDKFTLTCIHLKFLKMKQMDPRSYKHYLEERAALKKLARQLVETQGPKVCSDFQKEQVIESEHLANQ